MKKKRFIDIYSVFLNLGIYFCVQVCKSSAIDPNYVACQPRKCGNGQNISFPFYVQGVQDASCGYPGFELSCNKDGLLTMNLSENKFVIDRIWYNNQTFRVHYAADLNSSSICDPQQLKNVTSLGTQFEYVNQSWLYLLSNCTNSTVEKLQHYKVACANQYKDGLELAMLGNDAYLNYSLARCSRNVVAPVEASGGNVGYIGLLRRGFALKWAAPDCRGCAQSGGRCGFDATAYSFRCFCPDRPHRVACKNSLHAGKSELGIILGTAGGALFILVISIAIFLTWRRHKKAINSYFLSRNRSDTSSKADLEGGKVCFGVPVFSYGELEEITNNFDESNELGDGGFGTVYYGKLKDGREVAIKRLYEHSFKRREQFMNEVEILTRLRHRNLVSLYGCTSRRSRELLLVYEYIPNGTIADHLHGDRAKDNSLTWPVRMNISIETADALAYLHASDIIHRDVKTNNILLDHNFCVKVADFGLSRLFPNNVSHISTAPQGTPGYLDPEYHQSYQLTEKSDVYSFGVVLTELISSMPAIDISRHSSEINLATYAINRIQRQAFDELLDPSFRNESDPEVMRMTTCVAELAFRCLQLERDLRPTMDEVVETLRAIQSNKENFDEKTKENDQNSNDKKFQPSPNSVTDLWVSGSTIASTSG